jgi:hypothetical protein
MCCVLRRPVPLELVIGRAKGCVTCVFIENGFSASAIAPKFALYRNHGIGSGP